MQRRLEDFLTIEELADPDLVEFWLDDPPEAGGSMIQTHTETERPQATDASPCEQQREQRDQQLIQ